MKRQRGRGRNNNKSQNPNRALESNGPGVKVRGAASTIYEKYQQLARDAALAGDRIMAENYLQFAEHYFRIMRAQQAQREKREEEQAAQQAARKAEYEARKAQQQEQRAQQNAQAAPANGDGKTDGKAESASNGTGPMDVVTPQASPDIMAATPESAPEKPARPSRRRPRRTATSAASAAREDAGPAPSGGGNPA